MRLSVGIDCEVDLLFVSVNISVTLGAEYYGALVNSVAWPMCISGSLALVSILKAGSKIPQEFLYSSSTMVSTADPESDPPPGDKPSNENPCHTLHKNIIEGLSPNKPKSEDDNTFPSKGANTDWKVLAGPLQIRIRLGLCFEICLYSHEHE
ncbi:hypothetical protein VTL71DRAFT_10811 [Oculimacula yallundae]|uniref:Uncharacterized protein n=1 Tax=Oculimacula yallundae TaxID=86028 RepID=A0ABR4CUC7_9HELO